MKLKICLVAESKEKVEYTLNNKIEKIRDHIEKLNEKVSLIKEERVVQEKEFIHSLVDKIKEKELRNLKFEGVREQAYKEKVQKIRERNQKFAENALSVRMSEKEKVSNLMQKLTEAEKRIAAQKVKIPSAYNAQTYNFSIERLKSKKNSKKDKR